MNAAIKAVIVLTAVCAAAGAALSFTYKATYKAAEEARRADFLKSVDAVLPSHDNDPSSDFIEPDGRKVYLARSGGTVVGYAVESSSPKGYSGNIDMVVGISPEGRVIGAAVLNHRETPGLGDKITSKEFLKSFAGSSDPLKMKIRKDGGVIDQFSGASMSPRAVSDAVSKALEFINGKVLKTDR